MDLNYDSKKLIGKVKEVHKNLERKGWDWKSFYNGWIEGRANMLAELREGNQVNLESGKCNKHIVKPRFPKEQLHLKRGSRILNIRGRNIVNRPEILISCMEYWEPEDDDFGSAEENDATYYPTIEEIDKIIEALTEAKAFLNGA